MTKVAKIDTEIAAVKAASHAEGVAAVFGPSKAIASEAPTNRYSLEEGIYFKSLFNDVQDKRHSLYSSFYKKYRNIAAKDGLKAEQCSLIAREMGHMAVAAWHEQENEVHGTA